MLSTRSYTRRIEMRLTFSTENVKLPSFLDECRFAYDYGYSGFEIFDIDEERKRHADSIFRSGKLSDAKRKLRNRSLEISAVTFPRAVDLPDVTASELKRYVDFAASCNIERVIFTVSSQFDADRVKAVIMPAVSRAEQTDVEILFETSGVFAKTDLITEMIQDIASASIGVSWNVRETFFSGGESA